MDTKPRPTRHISPYHAVQGYADHAPLGRGHVLCLGAPQAIAARRDREETGLFGAGPIPPEVLEESRP